VLGLKSAVCTNSTLPEICVVVDTGEADISLVGLGVKIIWALVPSATTLALTSTRSSMLPPVPPMIGSEVIVSETVHFESMIIIAFNLCHVHKIIIWLLMT
jgi:hypothetical protein